MDLNVKYVEYLWVDVIKDVFLVFLINLYKIVIVIEYEVY